MDRVVTLRQRKQERTEEIRAAFMRLRDDLIEYGRAQGGRFWIYGSAATGNLHFESDIDILVDFPAEKTAAAVGYVERRGADLGLRVDVQPKAWCSDEFLQRVSQAAVVLP
jgi:predicted nucleotidyltransferase